MTTAGETKSASVGIVGSGVIGLTSALFLTAAGYRVTVVAEHMPGDLTSGWASPWAGALLAPHPSAGHDDVQEESIRFWHELLENHAECGIREIDITEYYNDQTSDADVWYRRLYPEMKSLSPKDLAPGAKIGIKYRGLVVDPNVFLPWIFTALQHEGVRFIRSRISSLRELQKLTGADVLVNASGLGARTLASDPAVHPIRGQTMFISVRDEDSPHHREAVIFQGSHYTYAIPRKVSGGVILGGVSQPRDERVEVDEALRPEILARVNGVTGGRFGWVDLGRDVRRDIVGFQPAREGGMRVERAGRVVHAYGVAGLGYVCAFGVAARVVKLVEEGGRAKL